MQDVVVQLENMRNADTQYYIIINAYKPYMLKKHPLTRKQSLGRTDNTDNRYHRILD